MHDAFLSFNSIVKKLIENNVISDECLSILINLFQLVIIIIYNRNRKEKHKPEVKTPRNIPISIQSQSQHPINPNVIYVTCFHSRAWHKFRRQEGRVFNFMYILWKYIAFQVFFLLFNIIGGVLKFHFSIQAHYFRIKIISDYKRNVYIKNHRVHLYVMYLYTTRASMCSHLL